MPPELRLQEARRVEDRHPALTASLKAAMYKLRFRDAEQAEKMIAAIPVLMKRETVPAVRKTKSGLKECDIKPWIYALRGEGSVVYATMALTEREACKPPMLLEALRREAGIPEEEEVRLLVVRTSLLGENDAGVFIPLEKL